MQGLACCDVQNLWEAWIDVSGTIGQNMLYVVGDVCTGQSKTTPVLKKKNMPGVRHSYLILELLPGTDAGRGPLKEVSYGEPVHTLNQYKQVWICVGENVVARINTIEVVV